jgi:hypothetical protein
MPFEHIRDDIEKMRAAQEEADRQRAEQQRELEVVSANRPFPQQPDTSRLMAARQVLETAQDVADAMINHEVPFTVEFFEERARRWRRSPKLFMGGWTLMSYHRLGVHSHREHGEVVKEWETIEHTGLLEDGSFAIYSTQKEIRYPGAPTRYSQAASSPSYQAHSGQPHSLTLGQLADPKHELAVPKELNEALVKIVIANGLDH